MSFTLRVVFDGVCAFVPAPEPFFSYTSGKWEAKPVKSIAVLLPNLQSAALASYKFQGRSFFREPHFPLLTFPIESLQGGTTRRVDLVAREPGRRDEVGVCLLNREQIRFKCDTQYRKDLSFEGWVPSTVTQEKPTEGKPEEVRSLWWLPRVDELTVGKHGRPRKDLSPDHLAGFPDDLAARVETAGGQLSVANFNRGRTGLPIPWRFAPPDDAASAGVWQRAIGNSLALEFFDIGEKVVLEMRRLGNEVHDAELVLAPPIGARNPVVEVRISNMELERLLGRTDVGRGSFLDPDFQAFYQAISIGPVDLGKQPIPNPAGKYLFLGIRDKPCSPSAYNPF